MTGQGKPGRWFGSVAVSVLLLALALQCLDARADLVLRPRGPGQMQATFTGPITLDDVARAERMAKDIESGHLKLADNTVWFASLGGDMDAGMELGRLLRRLRVVTVIGERDTCLSSCVFAFMGGERRVVHGRLGIHRPFFPTTQADPERLNRFRQMQRSLRDYLAEMDFPDSLYEAVMAVPPERMKMLAAEDLKRFYLVGISPSSEDLADAAAARRLGVSMVEYLRRKASASHGVAGEAGHVLAPAAAPDGRTLGSGEAKSGAP
jgi:hypothetical protein